MAIIMVDYDENDTFKVQLLQAMSSLIIAAFSLVAALAWNEAIKQMVAKVFGSDDDLLGLTVYAIIVTVLAVVMAIIITNAVKKAKAAQKPRNKQ